MEPIACFEPWCGATPQASRTMDAFVEIDNVRKSFDGGRTFAVDGITLQAEAGAFVALVGGSGSGKTTTLKFINRLIDPDGGAIRIDGKPVTAVDAPLLRR